MPVGYWFDELWAVAAQRGDLVEGEALGEFASGVVCCGEQ